MTDRPVTICRDPVIDQDALALDPAHRSPRLDDGALIRILLIGVNLRACITTVGPVLTSIRADTGISSSAASLLISIPVLSFGLFSSLAPVAARRFGLDPSMAAALAVIAAAVVLRSSSLPGALWVGTAAIGIAVAVLNVTLPSLVKRDFPHRVGQVTGLYSTLQGTAAALATGLVVPLSALTALGWRLGIGIWAIPAVIGLAIFLPQLRHTTRPEDRHPFEDAPTSRSPWRLMLAWQVTAYMGLQSTAFFAAVTWLPTYEQSTGYSASAAGWHLFIMLTGGLVGTIVCSRLIQVAPDQRVLAVLSGACFLVGFVGLLFVPNLAWVWMVFNGVGGGFAIVVALSLFGLRTRDYRDSSRLSGMAQTVGYLLAAIIPFAIGLLHDATSTWTAPLLVMTAVALLLMLAGYLAGRDRFLT